MAFTVAELIVAIGSGYCLFGACAAAAFLVFGIERVAPSAAGAYAFRPLLIPGLVLLWPLALMRWARLARRR